MKSRSITLLFVAGLLAAGAAWVANQWAVSRNLSVSDLVADEKQVVLAALDMPYSQKVEEQHVRVVSVPVAIIPEGAITNKKDVIGKVAAADILKGDILRQPRFVEHLEGNTLASLIDPTKRALTIRVNDVIGVAGFLLPGNFVDILFTKGGKKGASTTTLLQAIKVIAVDQKAQTNSTDPIIVRAITLEVTPRQAERIVAANSMGSIQLTLRNPSELAVAEEAPAPVRRVSSNGGTSFTIIRGTDVSVIRR